MKISRIRQYAVALLEMTDGLPQAEADKAVADFAKHLAKERMLGQAPEIMNEYQTLYNKKHGIVEATVTVVNRLEGPALSELKDTLKKKFSAADVKITQTVDERLLGGMKIQIGDQIFDSSLQNSIQQLQETLLTH